MGNLPTNKVVKVALKLYSKELISFDEFLELTGYATVETQKEMFKDIFDRINECNAPISNISITDDLNVKYKTV